PEQQREERPVIVVSKRRNSILRLHRHRHGAGDWHYRRVVGPTQTQADRIAKDPASFEIVVEISELLLTDVEFPIDDLASADLLIAVDAELDLEVEHRSLFLFEERSKELAHQHQLIQKFLSISRRSPVPGTARQRLACCFLLAVKKAEELQNLRG